jgi:hypothetical protein
MAFPSSPPSDKDKDKDHLLTLGIFHFILAGLGLAGLAFLLMHYLIMSTVFSNPHMWDNLKDKDGNPVPMPFNPAQFVAAFRWFYLLFGAWGVVSIVANLAAGICLRQGRSRTFLLFVAGFNCINFPFGTILGIFTILVLMRDSVRVLFASDGAALPAPYA